MGSVFCGSTEDTKVCTTPTIKENTADNQELSAFTHNPYARPSQDHRYKGQNYQDWSHEEVMTAIHKPEHDMSKKQGTANDEGIRTLPMIYLPFNIASIRERHVRSYLNWLSHSTGGNETQQMTQHLYESIRVTMVVIKRKSEAMPGR
jgi:hypothetical protein